MRNILLVVSANRLSGPALDFACYISRLQRSRINILLLESNDGENDTESRNGHRKELENLCNIKELDFSIREAKFFPAIDTIEESRFSDLLILEAATTLIGKNEASPTKYVKQVLKHAECPVIPGITCTDTSNLWQYGKHSSHISFEENQPGVEKVLTVHAPLTFSTGLPYWLFTHECT